MPCSSCSEAEKRLPRVAPHVVICERDLPDGCWKNLFSHLVQLQDPPPLLVVSRHADETLWAEVLNLGGYDVLQKPLAAGELARVAAMAVRHHTSPHMSHPLPDAELAPTARPTQFA